MLMERMNKIEQERDEVEQKMAGWGTEVQKWMISSSLVLFGLEMAPSNVAVD